MEISKRLEKIMTETKAGKRSEPVWTGPDDNGPNGGITFSLLSRFLVCRERFRLKVIEGLDEADQFNHRIEYGSMWHVCEEAVANGKNQAGWERDLRDYTLKLVGRYRMAQEQILHWSNICKIQFPVYQKHWVKLLKGKKQVLLTSEQIFSHRHELPSGRYVRLRGKMDSTFQSQENPLQGVWLMENKSKGDIREEQLRRQLTFDLQTMMYSMVLCDQMKNQETPYDMDCGSFRGVLYNVIRRPLSGGKYTIVQHKSSKSNPAGETPESFYLRLQSLIEEDPNHFFMRWNVTITQKDMDIFLTTCLNPVLEALWDWWEWIQRVKDPFTPHLQPSKEYVDTMTNNYHWRHPYGVYNPLNEGGSTELDKYLQDGSQVGLTKTTNLFPELGEDI